ncbi:MAG: hypothetical protein DLM52_04440, partial [Chthoniobacterales bacterium]
MAVDEPLKKRFFRRDAETSTRDACATRRRRVYGSRGNGALCLRITFSDQLVIAWTAAPKLPAPRSTRWNFRCRSALMPGRWRARSR